MKHPLAQFLYCPECGSPHFEVNNEKSKKCTDWLCLLFQSVFRYRGTDSE